MEPDYEKDLAEARESLDALRALTDIVAQRAAIAEKRWRASKLMEEAREEEIALRASIARFHKSTTEIGRVQRLVRSDDGRNTIEFRFIQNRVSETCYDD